MKNNKPLLSVVMCEHNTPIDFFKDAIESVLSQTYRNFELIVVNDCSTDFDSKKKYLTDDRIIILQNSENLGLAASRNVGIRAASGKYVIIMDTDDVCLKSRLKEQMKYMERHPNVICAGSHVQLFGNRNIKQRYKIGNNEYYRCCLLFGNSPTITNPSVIIRREVFKNQQAKYNESLKTAEDYDMWVQLSSFGQMKIIQKILLKYRIRSGQMSEVNRMEGLNNCEWAIIKKQLIKLGLQAEDLNEDFLRTDFRSPSIDPYNYFLWLQVILETNANSMCYKQNILKKRCKAQWKQKVFSINNKKIMRQLIQKMSIRNKIQIYFWILFRPFNIFVSFYDWLRSI